MSVVDHIEESMWYQKDRGEDTVSNIELFKESGYILKSSVLEREGAVI